MLLLEMRVEAIAEDVILSGEATHLLFEYGILFLELF